MGYFFLSFLIRFILARGEMTSIIVIFPCDMGFDAKQWQKKKGYILPAMFRTFCTSN